jgi:hypothetical protein
MPVPASRVSSIRWLTRSSLASRPARPGPRSRRRVAVRLCGAALALIVGFLLRNFAVRWILRHGLSDSGLADEAALGAVVAALAITAWVRRRRSAARQVRAHVNEARMNHRPFAEEADCGTTQRLADHVRPAPSRRDGVCRRPGGAGPRTSTGWPPRASGSRTSTARGRCACRPGPRCSPSGTSATTGYSRTPGILPFPRPPSSADLPALMGLFAPGSRCPRRTAPDPQRLHRSAEVLRHPRAVQAPGRDRHLEARGARQGRNALVRDHLLGRVARASRHRAI